MAAHSQSKYNLEIELVRKTYWAIRQQLKANSLCVVEEVCSGRQLLPVMQKVSSQVKKLLTTTKFTFEPEPFIDKE